ncbi:MAG: DNA helicase RecQ [Clostridia bacterium]|nr:DNA helicase RecQ [Clostridia bacterium]
MSDKLTVLKQYFGHSSFRGGQEAVVNAILRGQDALCVMPTGAGKSVCYQVPAMMLDGITLVDSPLISLMKDQVSALTQNGIPAAYINSARTPEQLSLVTVGLRRGRYKIVYVAPERLSTPEFLSLFCELKVSLLAVDEAHCISQWGPDFRPSYLQIADFADALWERPVIAAFTATATAEVKDDIEYSLRLRTPIRITTGFDRPNLTFGVVRSKNKFSDLKKILARHEGESGIVYCATRKLVERVATKLAGEGYAATVYHAGLESEVRQQNQEDFVYDRKTVMVATNAFGMGIDKSNVSFVVHYNMPQDVESYYQEAGRAGRDGSAAECVLLYSPADVRTLQYLINHPATTNPLLTPDEQEVLGDRAHDRLKQMVFYSTANTCLRRFMLNYFGEEAPNFCGNCSSCLTQFDDVDATIDAQKIMSCIKRTGEKYGVSLICDILRGSQSERILSLDLQHQTTYGLMQSYSVAQIRETIECLEYEGFIRTVGTAYPVLMLTPRSARILFEGETFVMKRVKPKEPSVKKKSTSAVETVAVDRELLAALKAQRRTIADMQGVPAYLVFTDAALIDMCLKHPTTHEEFLGVSGVGQTKLALYGDLFLPLIARYPAPDRHDEDVVPKKSKKRVKKLPFSITPEELACFEALPTPISTTELTKRISMLVEDVRERKMYRIKYRKLLQWLIDIELVEWREWEDGRMRRLPTALGEQMGLGVYIVETKRRRYPLINLSKEAQQLVADNLDAVLATVSRPRPTLEESEEDEEDEE